MRRGGVGWVNLAYIGDKWAVVNAVMNVLVP